MFFHYSRREITFLHFIMQLLLIFQVNKCISCNSASASASNSDSIIANTTEAFFVALKTTEYFSSGLETNSSSSSLDTGRSMNNNEPSGPVELLMSVAGRADLPEWMYYKFDGKSNTGYLYGSPVTDGEIDLEIIALNTRTYDTTMDTMKLTIVERESECYYFTSIAASCNCKSSLRSLFHSIFIALHLPRLFCLFSLSLQLSQVAHFFTFFPSPLSL